MKKGLGESSSLSRVYLYLLLIRLADLATLERLLIKRNILHRVGKTL